MSEPEPDVVIEEQTEEPAENEKLNHSLLTPCQANFRNAMQNRDVIEAFEFIEEMFRLCLAENRDEPFSKHVYDLHYKVNALMKYESLIFTQEARKLSDTTLFLLNDAARRRSTFKGFPSGRTLLTENRRRQLMKTMNAEPRMLGYGENTNFCLGIRMKDEDEPAYVDVMTEVCIPPIYKMKTSGRHTVFWCHDGRYFGTGLAKNMDAKPTAEYYKVPKELDFEIKKGEGQKMTGLDCCEHGTLFESNRRLFFVGDLEKAKPYLRSIHDGEFERMPGNDNLYLTHSRPVKSIMKLRIDDPRNVTPVRFGSAERMIKVYPDYWTEMTPGFTQKRPILYLLDGIEVRDVRIENICGSSIWVIFKNLFYNGTMSSVMMEKNDGDQENLDNYLLLVDLEEYRTATPFVATEVTHWDETVLAKCGDYPCVSFDLLEMKEEGYRGNVHKYMFEAVEDFMATSCSFSAGEEDKDTEEYTVDLLISEAEKCVKCVGIERAIELDWIGRMLPKYRYANYFSFLGYIAPGRLPSCPPKCFDTDIDFLVISKTPKTVARHRMKLLFEEFERVNYPGTTVWKPTEFLCDQPEPEDDTSTDGEFAREAMIWCLRKFIKELVETKDGKTYEATDRTNVEVIKYLVHTIRYACELCRMAIPKTIRTETSERIEKFLKACETRIPDTEPLFKMFNPGAILDSRIAEGYLNADDLDEPMDVVLRFRLKHRDPTLDDSLFESRTCRSMLLGSNPKLAEYIDEDGVIDFNEVYPKDTRLHRLIAQTHFIGYGLTDINSSYQYEFPKINDLSYTLISGQSYLVREKIRTRGYLFQNHKDSPPVSMVGLDPSNEFAVPIYTADRKTVYIHRMLPTLFSLFPRGQPLPPTLPLYLMMSAIRGLYDRKILDMLSMNARSDIVDWYFEAMMPEAFQDLLRQCILDVTSKDVETVRYFVDMYPGITQRLIAEHRPGILLWNHIPLPLPQLHHIKVITEMWPKNEFNRATRVPRKTFVLNGIREESNFHKIGSRQLRNMYTSPAERITPRYSHFYDIDFPVDEPIPIYRPPVKPKNEEEEDTDPEKVPRRKAKLPVASETEEKADEAAGPAE